MNWKTISSDYLFKDTWFTVRRDTCIKPDGKIVTPYYVYEFPTWVTALAMTEDNKVVMVKQYRHAIEETIIEIPGGCVDDTDKNLEEAIARELLEETGHSFLTYHYLGKISPNPSTNNNWMHMYLATGGKKIQEQSLDHNEDIEVVLLTIDELKELINQHKIVQAMHATTIFYGLQKLGEAQW
jgi:ADP-ribose pyrophosphatase